MSLILHGKSVCKGPISLFGYVPFSFFKEYSDMDIARLMKISHKTVAYRKQMAMKKLRILLEGTEDGRQENRLRYDPCL